MHKAFVYRLYPSKPQARLLDATLETCRRFYNQCLAERKQVWQELQRTVGKIEQLRTVKILKATNPYAKNVHSHVVQAVVQDLDKTFQAFFRRVKSGAEKSGFLRFQGRNRFRSFGFKERGNGFKMVHSNLAKSILDAGWGYLKQRLMHKAASAGRETVLVDPRYTSKTCSNCGHIFVELSLQIDGLRVCGLSLDRDHNAAINILNQGGQLRWSLSSPGGGLGQEAVGL